MPTHSESPSAEGTTPGLSASMLRGPSFVGSVGALVFFWFSLTPSLLPRWWVMQAVITGLTAAIGYLIGATIGVLGSAGIDRFNTAAPAERTRRIAWRLLALAAVPVVVIGLARWPSVQNASRDLVNLDSISWTLAVAVALAAAAIFLVVCAAGRIVLYVVRRTEAFAQRFMPRAAAWIVTLALVAVIAYILSVDLVERQLIGFVDARFGAADTGTAVGVVAPSQPEYSGSPDSLVPWETLGLEGRNFVAGAPSAGEIGTFSGSGAAQTPIRVYAGLDSAATLEQRAALVALELDRTNAADRAAVVVVTTTGTGWVDPDAAAAVEYMYDGDTAIAAMQYSFLPSWIQFLVGTELAGEAGAAINAAAFDWWKGLDEPRPKLLLFGESLGSLGLETALSRDSVDESLESLTRSDGVLLTGPTASNPIWQQIAAARESSTPVWKPVYDSGATVRIANQPQDPDSAGSAEWAEPRVLYFHHPSDPVGYWDLKTLWARPEWVDDPVGYDVSPDVGWFPIVTWGQVSGDLIAGFSAGPGFGHNYSVDFVSGWASVAPPQGWTADETARLQAHLEVASE